MHIAEIDLAVSCTPRSLSPRSDAYRRDLEICVFLVPEKFGTIGSGV